MSGIKYTFSKPSLPVIHGVEIRHFPSRDGYAVGDDGSVWSCMPRNGTGKGCGKTNGFSVAWHTVSSHLGRSGYPQVYIGNSRRCAGKHYPLHCLVLEVFVGPRPRHCIALHNDGNKYNCQLTNLRWGTDVENKLDLAWHRKHPLTVRPGIVSTIASPVIVKKVTRKCKDTLRFCPSCQTKLSVRAFKKGKRRCCFCVRNGIHIPRSLLARDQAIPPLPEIAGVEIRSIDGFVGYAVSSVGDVWTCKSRNGRGLTRRWRKLKAQKGRSGYTRVKLSNFSRINVRYANICHIVLETFRGPRPDGMVCRHLDDNKRNSRLDNLCWGTCSENSKDCVRNGHNPVVRSGKDSWRGSAKLTAQQVLDVRQKSANGHSFVELAKIYGVKASAISSIVTGKSWNHLTGGVSVATERHKHDKHLPYGAFHHAAKLTPEAVRDIRQTAGPYGSKRRLAKKYGISVRAIRGVLSGATWKHVK